MVLYLLDNQLPAMVMDAIKNLSIVVVEGETPRSREGRREGRRDDRGHPIKIRGTSSGCLRDLWWAVKLESSRC